MTRNPCICAYTYIQMPIQVHTHTGMHVDMNTYIHIQMHTSFNKIKKNKRAQTEQTRL